MVEKPAYFLKDSIVSNRFEVAVSDAANRVEYAVYPRIGRDAM